mmetsp:Transcript_19917/g.25845  ORF Transcript_19917/g.25845 Transcript_19917/m.25845 type:complete len:322 (+) Transcript_19917:140-1105(+)
MGLPKTFSFTCSVCVFLAVFQTSSGSWEQPEYSEAHYEWMRSTTCNNMDEVLVAINFEDDSVTPYGDTGDTTINYSKNCYVVFPNETTRSEYRLESGTEEEMNAANKTALGYGNIFMTHETPCGACSDLENLATYLSVPDLTSPVRSCGIGRNEQNHIRCLEDIGFRGHCTWIWYYNTVNTKLSESDDGCFGICVLYMFSPNIEETGTNNYCDPSRCENTINGQPACSADQWENGPYRLNPCLQCDECRSGPVFKKVAGRTRRDSGIPSAIPRPPDDIVELTHYYGMFNSQGGKRTFVANEEAGTTKNYGQNLHFRTSLRN